jgi:hypothetical protein
VNFDTVYFTASESKKNPFAYSRAKGFSEIIQFLNCGVPVRKSGDPATIS